MTLRLGNRTEQRVRRSRLEAFLQGTRQAPPLSTLQPTPKGTPEAPPKSILPGAPSRTISAADVIIFSPQPTPISWLASRGVRGRVFSDKPSAAQVQGNYLIWCSGIAVPIFLSSIAQATMVINMPGYRSIAGTTRTVELSLRQMEEAGAELKCYETREIPVPEDLFKKH